jgi:Glu-tRNA(Gln) amidotransferase subunit E-like FAD-binding protein
MVLACTTGISYFIIKIYSLHYVVHILERYSQRSLVLISVSYLQAHCHTQFLRPKPDAHRMYAQDQVVIHTARM